MKCLLFALTLFAVLAAVSPCRADGELRALQDSVVRWLAAHPDDLLAEAAADVGGQGEELFGRELFVGQTHHVVQDGRDGGVASESHFGDHDSGHGRGMRQQGAAVIAGQGRKLPVGVDQRLVHECLSLLREVRAHERAEFFVT